MIIRALLMLLIITVMFGGCAHTHVHEVKQESIKEIPKHESIPKELLVKTKMPKPPSIEVFRSSDTTKRMELLTGYMKELMSVIKTNNESLEKIKEWNDKHK